jgi:hypothetical protein
VGTTSTGPLRRGLIVIPAPLRELRIPIATRVLAAGALSLIVLAIALLTGAKQSIQSAVYAQIVERVQIGENTLSYLVNERGSAKINSEGDLQFGSWVVKGDYCASRRPSANSTASSGTITPS